MLKVLGNSSVFKITSKILTVLSISITKASSGSYDHKGFISLVPPLFTN